MKSTATVAVDENDDGGDDDEELLSLLWNLVLENIKIDYTYSF